MNRLDSGDALPALALSTVGFVVRPGGAIATECYSTGAIGSLSPDEVLRAVRFWKR